MEAKIYDLVIKGGRVMDPETKLDAIRNVGVNGDKIEIITQDDIMGKETIDAKGLVVAPGFLDMHQHNTGTPFGEKLAMRDGVTTPMELEVGATRVKEIYASLEGKCRLNYGFSSGTMSAREIILNPEYKSVFNGEFLFDIVADGKDAKTSMMWSKGHMTSEQDKEFEKLLCNGIEEGALGVGHPVGYMTAGCSQQNSITAQKVAGKYGMSTFVHGRFSGQMPPTSGLLGFLEMMGPQEIYGGAIVFQHMHAQALADIKAALDMFSSARKKGIKVIPEIYPYNYGATILGADYLKPDNYGPNMGRDYDGIIKIADLKPYDKDTYDEGMKENPMQSVMFYNSTDEDMYYGLAHPESVIGSDAFIYTVRATGETAFSWDIAPDSVNGHPRGSGTHALFLRLVREKKVDIPLMTAISKMTNMISDYLAENGVSQMNQKGRIQVGKDADITIFDPATVTDNSTMQNGGLQSTGIPYVICNGTLVVKDSECVENVFPGKPVWGDGKKKL